MKNLLFAFSVITLLSACSILDEKVEVFTAEGTVETTTVGDLVADSAPEVSEGIGSVVGMLTGNPMLAGGAAALAAAAMGGAARRRKKAQVVTAPAEAEDLPQEKV